MTATDGPLEVNMTAGATGLIRWLALVVLALVLVVGVARIAADPFGVSPQGYSHDGMNGRVWSEGADALRADPVESKMGAVHLDGWVYAHHPPLILVETAAAQAIFGERTWADRIPAWLGTLAAVSLLGRVMRREGFGPTSRAVGLLVGFGTPMVFAYGAMLDTPVTSLPFGAGCLLVWQRERDRCAAWWERPVVLAVTVLAGWQAALLAGLTLLPRWSWRAVAGFAAGVGMVLGWQMWVHGGLGDLLEQLANRSVPDESVNGSGGLGSSLRFQAEVLWGLVTPITALVGVVGLWLGRRRTLLQLAIGATVLFPLVTIEAFGIHDYWMFWVTLPLCLAGAEVAAVRRWSGIEVPRLVLAAGVVVAVLALTVPSSSVQAQDYGVRAVERSGPIPISEAGRPG